MWGSPGQKIRVLLNAPSGARGPPPGSPAQPGLSRACPCVQSPRLCSVVTAVLTHDGRDFCRGEEVTQRERLHFLLPDNREKAVSYFAERLLFQTVDVVLLERGLPNGRCDLGGRWTERPLCLYFLYVALHLSAFPSAAAERPCLCLSKIFYDPKS